MRSSERGATLVETAITLPIFIFIVFGLVQICLVAYTSLAVQYHVNHHLRKSAVHKELSPGESKFDSLRGNIVKGLNSFHINTSRLQVNMCEGVVEDCSSTVSGSAGSFVTLQAKVPAFNLFPLGELVVTGRAVIKNEQY